MSLDVVEQGRGAPLLMIHGSATDHRTWSVQLASLSSDFTMLCYDRRRGDCGVECHADDAAEILRSHVVGPAMVVGSSFGAVVALDLARRFPSLVNVLLLCEPPLASSDQEAPLPDGFEGQFDRLVEDEGGAAAAEYFLRSVLGDQRFERMPKAYRQRSMAAWQQIREDMGALLRYRVRYAALASELTCKTLLIAGEQSSPYYRATLASLASAIPRATLHVLRGAGHMMQVDAFRQFNALLLGSRSQER